MFSVLFKDNVSAQQVTNFLEALRVFKLGLSWGGVTSLAIVYPALDRPGQDVGGRLVRLNIGLEAPDDLVEDLRNAILTGLK